MATLRKSNTDLSMLEILPLIALSTIVAVALVGIDCYAIGSKVGDSDSAAGNRELLGDLALFSPFLALFYTEDFWVSLICTAPIILIAAAMQRICYKKGWLDSPAESVTLAPGSYLLTIIVYFIFFHEGFAEAPPHEAVEANAGGRSSVMVYWISALYFVCFLLAVVPKNSDSIFLSLLFLIPAITILPFFTSHYFWFMLLGFLFLLISVHRGLKHLEAGSGGALSAVGGYFYMLAAFASIVVYAILY